MNKRIPPWRGVAQPAGVRNALSLSDHYYYCTLSTGSALANHASPPHHPPHDPPQPSGALETTPAPAVHIRISQLSAVLALVSSDCDHAPVPEEHSRSPHGTQRARALRKETVDPPCAPWLETLGASGSVSAKSPWPRPDPCDGQTLNAVVSSVRPKWRGHGSSHRPEAQPFVRARSCLHDSTAPSRSCRVVAAAHRDIHTHVQTATITYMRGTMKRLDLGLRFTKPASISNSCGSVDSLTTDPCGV
jgi:hypothetical protein